MMHRFDLFLNVLDEAEKKEAAAEAAVIRSNFCHQEAAAGALSESAQASLPASASVPAPIPPAPSMPAPASAPEPCPDSFHDICQKRDLIFVCS